MLKNKKVIIASAIILVVGIVCAIIIFVNRSNRETVVLVQSDVPSVESYVSGETGELSSANLVWTTKPLSTDFKVEIIADTYLYEKPTKNSNTVNQIKTGETYILSFDCYDAEGNMLLGWYGIAMDDDYVYLCDSDFDFVFDEEETSIDDSTEELLEIEQESTTEE